MTGSSDIWTKVKQIIKMRKKYLHHKFNGKDLKNNNKSPELLGKKQLMKPRDKIQFDFRHFLYNTEWQGSPGKYIFTGYWVDGKEYVMSVFLPCLYFKYICIALWKVSPYNFNFFCITCLISLFFLFQLFFFSIVIV